ncbi:MAG: methyltransferase domain-containing protein [Bacteroidota bacterium]
MPKFFPPHFRAIAQALEQIFKEGKYADRVVMNTLKADKRRGSQDRAFIAENTYDVVRNYRLLSYLAGDEPRDLEDWWRLIGIRLMMKGKVLPKWHEFSRINPRTVEKRLETARKRRAIWESVPEWLDQRAERELGNKWPGYLSALNNQAPVFLRVNRIKTSPKQLAKALAEFGAITKVIGEETLLVKERKNLFSTAPFKEGLFEVQDLHSQRVAPALDLEAGHTLIDACAGAGGKTLHAASIMGNKGRIIALDTEEWKLKDLRKRARRAGVQNIETRPITSTKVVKRLSGRADRLLLDVPCSGMGVLRRNPDAKWKMTDEFIERMRSTQQDILQRYSRMLKPNGLMVYATCSILPSENREQVDRFLASEAGADFKLLSDESLAPQAKGGDGFYLARLQKAAAKQQPVTKSAKQQLTSQAPTKPPKTSKKSKAQASKTGAKADDLKKITGIGPKMAAILQTEGISTFAQLAAADQLRLSAILAKAGPRFKSVDLKVWQKQAAEFAQKNA